jgi:hypothetical protein
MSRVATAHTLKSSAFCASVTSRHLSCIPKARHDVRRSQPVKYDRRRDTFVLCLENSLNVPPGHYIGPKMSLSSGLRPRWSIHHHDSWNWTSRDVRWFAQKESREHKADYLPQIHTYLERWCSNPPHHMKNPIDQQELKDLFDNIIKPTLYGFLLFSSI